MISEGGDDERVSIDESYREDLRLRDGTRIRLRMVRQSDKQRLAEGLVRFSIKSRRGRFFGPKPSL